VVRVRVCATIYACCASPGPLPVVAGLCGCGGIAVHLKSPGVQLVQLVQRYKLICSSTVLEAGCALCSVRF
jgi:hypothetical protein